MTGRGSFSYDPAGRLSDATLDGTKTQFLYDGDVLVAEYDDAGTLIKRYVHGDQVDEPLVEFDGTGTSNSNTKFLHTDHQGSIIAHSNAAGTTTHTLAYDSYGISAMTNNSRFAYTGQIEFEELGLYYYKARFYDPKLGRFLQADPIGYEDQMNLYAYVHNDPLNYSDPSGKASVVAWALRLGASTAKLGDKLTKPQAVQARQAGQNVQATSRSMAKQIETAAHGSEKQLKHQKGHKLPDGSTGRPHFQTDGVKGHTFWGILTAALLGTAEMLDSAAAVAEVIDPTTYLISGGQYDDGNGNLVLYSELRTQETSEASSAGSSSSNSDRGMSGGNVTICSGMGAQKGGC